MRRGKGLVPRAAQWLSRPRGLRCARLCEDAAVLQRQDHRLARVHRVEAVAHLEGEEETRARGQRR